MLTNPDSLINNTGNFADSNYDYDYPDGLDLKPGSELHQKLLSRLLRYSWESSRTINARKGIWQEMDDKLTGYIPVTDEEKVVKEKDPRKPISIVFPYSYAILETLVSYMVAAFFPDPMFRYEGASPEDITGAFLLEKVVNTHVNRTKVALNLHTMFRDAGAYGFGVVSPQWTVKTGKKFVKNELGSYDSRGEFTRSGFARNVEETVLFEGNSLVNIDPYCYLPDPNFPIHEVQRGEFVGWMDRSSYMDLYSDEQNDEDMFNVRYLRHVKNKSSNILFAENRISTRNHRTNVPLISDRSISDVCDLLHIYVKLIPSQWNLGDGDVPEKWLFSVASDAVIIKAKPIDLNHNLFPVAICAPDFDGYSPVAYSRLEILKGMQTTVDFLFNSHIANVRKAINDMLVVDPYLINVDDLRNPEAGKIIRLRRPAWGKGIQNAVQQLNIVDITRNNLQDVSFLIQYMQQVSGIDNPLMGSLRQGGPERLSASEYQGTSRGAVSRLERIAKIIGLQAMQDIGYLFAYHTQQLMNEETYVRTVGEWPEVMRNQFEITNEMVKVSPYDILVDYDIITRDGSIPGGNFSDVWTDLFRTIGQNEILLQQFDIVRIFKYIATNLGAKNVDQFERKQPPQVQATVAPDEAVAQQVQNGNLVELLRGAGNGAYVG